MGQASPDEDHVREVAPRGAAGVARGGGAGARGGAGGVAPVGGARRVEPGSDRVPRVAAGALPRPGPAPLRAAGAVAARGGDPGAVAGAGGRDGGRAGALDAGRMGGGGGRLGAAVTAGVDAAEVRVRPVAPGGLVGAGGGGGVSVRDGGGALARAVARPDGGEVGAGARLVHG